MTRATDHDHMVKDTIQTPKTDRTHLAKGKTTTDNDLEITHLQKEMITIEIAFQIKEILSARAG